MWKIESITTPNGNHKEILSFKGATYPDTQYLIPHFHEIKNNITPNHNYEAHLSETTFIPLTKEEKQLLNGISIEPRISVRSQLLYHRKKPFLEFSFIPIRKNPNTGQLEKLTHFKLNTTSKPKNLQKTSNSDTYKYSSVLNKGKWVKIAIDSTAIYRITYQQLLDMGISNPEGVGIYGYGGGMLPKMNNQNQPDDLPLNRIWYHTGSDNIFNKGDYILFYAQGPRRWSFDTENNEFIHENHSYSKESCYFLSCDLGNTAAIINEEGTQHTPNTNTNEFDDYLVIDDDKDNLLQSGQLWVDRVFDISTKHSFDFYFPNLIIESPLKATTHLIARSDSESQFIIKHKEKTIGTLKLPAVNTGSFTSLYASDNEIRLSNIIASDSRLHLEIEYLKSSPSSIGWLNYLRVQARRRLKMTGSQMSFRDTKTVSSGNITQFKIKDTPRDIMIWDVSNPQEIKNIIYQKTGTTSSFTLPTSTLREFVALDPTGDFPTPRIAGTVSNQNLHASDPADYIIICPKPFISQATKLAKHHRSNDKMRVIVTTPESIYNEFSSGIPDVAAIRNFVKMFYDRAKTSTDMPKYLLLFGDGSYDNMGIISGTPAYIPTYQSKNSLSPTQSFVSDDFFGLLDLEEGGAIGSVDIGIGRLPVNTSDEAQIVVDKICSYKNPDNMGSWHTRICFIGDDEDNNTHMHDANQLANIIEENHPQYNTCRVMLDSYLQENSSTGEIYPEVNRKINDEINNGLLIFNYTGHGNENGLAHEHILTIEDILNWRNQNKMPLFITATCEFSRFDNFQKRSAGELILLHNKGGGIGLFSTTRLVFSAPNFVLNQNLYNFVFSLDKEGNHYRLGDIMRLTKQASGNGINKRSFTLLGDPALTLNYPKERVRTLMLNQKDINSLTDTLKALSKITITGQIETPSGEAINNFQGILYASVYDKKVLRSTLGNDGNPFSYEEQKNALFHGKASINNGKFTFTFMVPKDINYQYGEGRISYYATNSSTDAAGSTNSIIIGGSKSNSITDKQGPVIDLFMNNQQFASGGITDPNPLLIAILQDSSGINTMGTTIGHDLRAILDGDSRQSIKLNDYYESDLDKFQSGSINYQLSDLTPGEHQIKVKVWDNANNSSEAELDFVVAENAKLALENVLNYPNPFTSQTGFYFDHNMPYCELDVIIQILTISGRPVKSIETTLTPQGYRVGPIKWDGHDDFGQRIGRGVYIYRLKVQDSEGRTATKYQKLVLLK